LTPLFLASYQDKLYQLDGVSLATEETGDLFYRRFVQQSVDDALTGADRTVLMYGPTGTGKTYTMFSSAEGVAHLALRQVRGLPFCLPPSDGCIAIFVFFLS
jgi:hypothetical protein